MRTVISILIALAACSSPSNVPDRPPEQEAQIADSRIVVAVKDRLAEDAVPGNHRIRVDCVTGVVTLAGSVPSKEAAAAAVASAGKVSGVKNVINRLAVSP